MDERCQHDPIYAMHHAHVTLDTFAAHPSSWGFWLRLKGMQQRGDDLMIKTLYRWQMYIPHPDPLGPRTCFRYFRDIPHSLPRIHRKPRFTKSNKCIAPLVYFREHMECAPVPRLDREVYNQFRQVRMGEVCGRTDI